MSKKKNSISFAKQGMNREISSHLVDENTYTFMLNGNNETSTGDRINVTNEPSSLLTTKFPEGYKNIGYRNDLNSDRTFYILTNPTTRKSSIGYIKNTQNLQSTADLEAECGDCDFSRVLSSPLEGQTQTPTHDYVELINDSCNGDLNLDINFPIKNLEIKTTKLGTTLYFADNRNPSRYFNTSKVDSYKFKGDILCGIDERVPTCIDVSKMLLDPNYNIPHLEVETLQIGGNLKMGTYTFTAAYCDIVGNEITEFCTPTNPVSIFDENNSIILQQELNQLTNFAIKVKVKNLDKRFKYYKVVVIEKVNLNNTESYYEEGIHSTTDDTILYTTSATIGENNLVSDIVSPIKRTTLDHILQLRPRFARAEGVEAANRYLFQHGLTAVKEDNLQPVFNMLGAFVKWRSSIAKENLYKSAIATSNYKGYMRDEVSPFSARLLYKGGDYSANFNLVARPATTYDKEVLPEGDLNLISITNNSPNCTVSTRDKRWQVYNTATNDGFVGNLVGSGIEGEYITKESTKLGYIPEVFTIPGNTYIIPQGMEFDNLADFINDNISKITTATSGEMFFPDIKNALNDTYPSQHNIPDFTECDSPVLISEDNSIGSVYGSNLGKEALNYDLNFDATTYTKTVPPAMCQVYAKDEEGKYQLDNEFRDTYMICPNKVYTRSEIMLNEVCAYAADVADNIPPKNPGQGYFHNYYGGLLPEDITITSKNSILPIPDANYQNNLHKGALWFKIDRRGRDEIIFEITKNTACKDTDSTSMFKSMRYTFYEKCSSTNPIISPKVINTTNGELIVLDLTSFPKNYFYVAIDAPIVQTTSCVGGILKYRVAPPCGCFSVSTRDLEKLTLKVTTTGITINKIEEYIADCTYFLPKVNDCKPTPYEEGKMAYWQSEEVYPDNAELYDSSKLRITYSDLQGLTAKQRIDFDNYFKDSIEAGVYKLKTDLNLQCKPIRHHKFPDNSVSPFMGTETPVEFAETIIFPIGIHLDNNVVNTFLDIAVNNNLISKERRDNIVGFEIFKGDNSISKSVITNALGYDMYKYKERGKDVFYANYPHNDLGKDQLHSEKGVVITHPNGGNYNSKFSLISPEFEYSKPAIPSEIMLTGYQLGNSRGYFADVEDHSKWVILSPNARKIAGVIAGLEVALEVAIKATELIVQGTGQTWVMGGLVFGTNAIGSGISLVATIVLGALQLTSSVMTIGKRKLQWETTFRDLGSPQNFASFYTSEGYHNKFLVNKSKADYIRALSTKKYVRDGRFSYTDENTGKILRINNKSREHSVIVSLGDERDRNDQLVPNYKSNVFTYDTAYKIYDNNVANLSSSSRTISSQNTCSKEEIQRNVGSPYFTLKNYLPAQYGDIDTVRWISTNYTTDLRKSNINDVVFGGTVFISRFTYKRKLQMFKTTAFGLPDKLPFSYSNYQNIADAVYYCDYESGGDSPLFPTIKSDYRLDCETRGQFYMKPPSKFYLYYYGIANYLVESEINCNYRYGKKELEDQFYPQVGDLVDWTQEKNVPISKKNTFFYNEVYSMPVIKTLYRTLNKTYSKEVWDKKQDLPNGVIYSLQSNAENDENDPWLIYKTLNRYEFDTSYGKLIGIKSLESETILGRFENQQVVFNAIDNLANEISPRLLETGTGGIFAKRPIEFKATDLGYAGTQHSEMVSTPYGHFTIDAKRGKIFLLDQVGKPIQPISEVVGQKDSGMKNWFKEQLPFKILRQFPNVDVDNKYKGIGLSMGWDARYDRVFITKKDYIAKNLECLKYSKEEGFYTDCGSEVQVCPEGYTLNTNTNKCEKVGSKLKLCPEGYTYNLATKECTIITP